MSNNWIGLQEPGTLNKLLDTEQVTGGGPTGTDTVQRERFLIAGAALAEIARVINTTPSGSEYALVVRTIIGSQPLPTGAATEATLATLNTKVTLGHGLAASAILVELPTDGTGRINAVQSGTWAVTQSGAWTVAATQSGSWSLAANQSVNISQIGGSAVLTGSGTAAGALRVELPTDGIGKVNAAQAGTWTVSIAGTVPISGAVTVSGTVAATQSGGWTVAATQSGTWNVTTVSTVTTLVGGSIAHGSADGGNPIKVGGRARTTDIAAVTADSRIDLITSLLGKQVMLPYALPGQAKAFASATGGLITTAGVTMFASAGAGIKNLLTRLQVINSNPTVGTEVVVRDGSSGPVLWRGWAQPAGGGCVAQFDPPLAGTANTLMEVAEVTSTPTNGVIVSAQAYTGAE